MLGVQLLGSVNPNMFTPFTPGPLGLIVFGVQILGSVHHIMCSPSTPGPFGSLGFSFGPWGFLDDHGIWTFGGFGHSGVLDVLGFGLLGVWTLGPFFGRFGFGDAQGSELDVGGPFLEVGG